MFLIHSVSFILMNNFFEYDGAIYHQIRGTAMGTHMAPFYTNLFMGIFESNLITSNNPFTSKIHIYKRYIDDLFLLWEGNEKEAEEFTDYINQNPWGIKFTLNYSEEEIQFLDLNITHKN